MKGNNVEALLGIKDYGYKKWKTFQVKNQSHLVLKWRQKMAVCSKP